jgi:hypothetical protein
LSLLAAAMVGDQRDNVPVLVLLGKLISGLVVLLSEEACK